MATRCMVAGSPDAEAPPPAGDGARSSTGSDSTAGGTGGVILVVSSLAGVYPLSTGWVACAAACAWGALID